jgi:heterokaryon incompatibility protein (HET)
MPLPYSRLQHPASELRLVKLLPADHDNDPIVIELVHAEIKKSRYHALSYVWGDQTTDAIEIEVQYASSHHENTMHIAIGNNLGQALRCLRRDDGSMFLFVDAISINQADDEEKSAQVQAMFSIYEHAELVVAWLGPSSPNIDSAIHFVNTIGLAFEEFVTEQGLLHQAEGQDVLLSMSRELLMDPRPKDVMSYRLLPLVAAFMKHLPDAFEGLEAMWINTYWTRCWVR